MKRKATKKLTIEQWKENISAAIEEMIDGAQKFTDQFMKLKEAEGVSDMTKEESEEFEVYLQVKLKRYEKKIDEIMGIFDK